MDGVPLPVRTVILSGALKPSGVFDPLVRWGVNQKPRPRLVGRTQSLKRWQNE